VILTDQRGQAMVEYAFTLVLVALVVLTMLVVMGTSGSQPVLEHYRHASLGRSLGAVAMAALRAAELAGKDPPGLKAPVRDPQVRALGSAVR